MKVLNRNYPSIQHLQGSKLIDDRYKMLDMREQEYLTVKTRNKSDIVIVTEKVDGCNVGVIRNGDNLIAVSRKGYNVTTSPFAFIREFDEFVQARKERFMSLLNDGERVCGEWMVKTHTLRYKMKHEPFICFDLISDSYRDRYSNAKSRLEINGFTTAGLVHYGTAIPVNVALEMADDGFHGVLDGIEGVVYRYESKDGFICSGKYVSNPLVGNKELFNENIDNPHALIL